MSNSSVSNLILIDSRLPGIPEILASLTPNTDSLLFEFCEDTFESIQARIVKPYTSVAIAQHNYGLPMFNLVSAMVPAYMKNSKENDPELESWSEFASFLQWLKRNGANSVDFLACDLWASPDWKYVIETLRSRLGLTIRASIDITGVDGNFVLESDNVDTIGIYFTTEILNYKHNFYTVASPEDMWGYPNYVPLIYTAENPGYISATAYSAVLGWCKSPHERFGSIPRTTDISNVLMVSMGTQSAAVVQTTGNVITFGSIAYGASPPPAVATNLYNITKVVSTSTWFSALRSDGRAFAWGGYYDVGQFVDINSWVNIAPWNEYVLISDVSNTMVNLVEIYANAGACFGLNTSGGLIGWGMKNAGADTKRFPFSSGIIKVIPGRLSMIALKNNGVAYFWAGTYITDSNVNSVNSNIITDAFTCDYVTVYMRTTPTNTTQITNLSGSVLYYTVPAGVRIVRTEVKDQTGIVILLSNNVLLIIVGLSCTVVNNVTDVATNPYAFVYLQNGTVVANGNQNYPYGSKLVHATRGVPTGVSLDNVRRLISSGSAVGALKFDNTFVWWGQVSEPYVRTYESMSMPTLYPALYAAISSNIASVYACQSGFVFNKLDGTIISFGPTSWHAALATTNYGARRTGKSVGMVPSSSGFIAIESTPISIATFSQYKQYEPTTVTYYNNNPDMMALRGRKYSLMVGDAVVGTFVCPADTFTYTFRNTVFTQLGLNTITICDTPDYVGTNKYVIETITATILSNSSVSPPEPPIITNVASASQQITISFIPPAWNGGSEIIGYKYSTDLGQTYTTLPATARQLVLTGLNGSTYTVRFISTSYVGDSYHVETVANMYNVPSAPTIASVVSGNQQVVLNVSTSNNGGGAITGYKYAFSVNGPFTSFAVSPTGGATGVTAHTITGLLNNTPYTLYVKSTNGAGDSVATTASSSFTLSKTAPNVPSITSVVAGNASMTVNFTAPYNGGDSFTGYRYILNNSVMDLSAVTIAVVSNSFVISGLTNGTAYTVKMSAVNSIGTSAYSSVSSEVVPKTVAGAPTINSVSSGNRQVIVEFTGPASNGGSGITQYNYRLNGGSPQSIGGLSSPFTIGALTNGTTYTLTLSSVNAAGESLLSSASDSFTPSTLPATPIIQSIIAGNQTISVAFTVDNGGSALTFLEYSLNDASDVSIATTSSPLVLSGLTNGTNYRVKLRAINQNGASELSAYSNYATPKTVPTAPSIDSIEAGNQYIEFAFSPPEDNGSSEITGYKYSINGGSYSSVGIIQSPYRITNGIQNGTSYSVRLIASNIVGDSPASVVSDSVVPNRVPDAPQIVSVQVGDKTATIQLSAGNDGGSEILSYTYSVNSSEPVVIGSLSSLEFANLDIGTVYSFQIKATNSVGDSSNATASFTGMSVPDSPIIVGTTAGNNSAIIEFTVPSANSSSITGYKYSIASGVYLSATLLDATHISISGLSANTEYSVILVAINAIGQSADSEAGVVTPYTHPLAPTITEITVDNGTASVEFSAQSDNGSAITQYKYSINNGNYVSYDSVVSPLELTDLSNGVAYTIRMKAVNAAGVSVVASSASFMPRTVPELPVITSVTAGNASCDIGFTPGFFNGAPITKYRYSLNGVDFQDAFGTVSPITIEGLTNGNTYMVYLLAVNSVGESNISAPSSSFVPFVTQSTANPPVDLSVVAGNSSAIVSFTDGVNAGSAIKGYMYSIDGGVTRLWAQQFSSPLEIVGLVNGDEHTIQLAAVNNSGMSEWSSASEPFTPCAVPDAPILTGVQGGDETIIVSFIPGASNGSDISSYEYSLDGSASFLPLLDSIPYTIYGVSNGTSYTVRIRAVNAVGVSLPSYASTTVVPFSVPNAPVINSVESGDARITVNFTAGDANGSTTSYYEYCLIRNGVSGEFKIAPSVESPMVISGLDNGVEYNVLLRVVSTQNTRSESSNTSSIIVPSAVPSTPIITKLLPGNGSIVVNWTAVNNGSAITSVLYNLNGGPYVDSGSIDASFAITGLVNGSSYSMRLVVVNSAGSSSPSAESAEVSPLSAPEPPTVLSVVPGESRVQVNLNPGNANGSSVLGYKYTLDGINYSWVNTNTSPISIYGLVNGTNYNISLAAVGETVGDSSSVEISQTPVMPYRSPDAPVIQSISTDNNSAVVTFVDGNANGLTLTGYKYSLDEINYMDISAVNNTITLTGLTNGTSYAVSMKAVSTVSTSPPSVLSAPFVPYTAPSPPIIGRIVTGDRSVSISIVDGSANGSGATLAYRCTFDDTNYFWASSSTSPIVISSGLVNNQGYRIRVATKTELGMSAFCAQSSTFVPYTLPGQPVITTVIPGNAAALLYFIDGSSNGRPISFYKYTINGIEYPEVTGISPLQLTGLTNGTSYTVTLKNANLAGYSISSFASNVFIPYNMPSAPTITNLVPLANQIAVFISPGNANGSVITRYSYSLNGGSYVNTADAALSFVITGLTNGTNYTVAVKAENAAGVGAASATSAGVIPFTVPDAPTITSVTVGNNSATVAITNGNNNGRTSTQYQYTYTSSEGSTTLTTSTSATQLSSILITGLTNWTNYTVTVRAINAAGMSVASAASSSFMPFNIPGAPVIASVVPGNASITVNMDGLTIGAGVVGYKYSFDNVTYTYKSGGGSSFDITDLTNATSYQVYVKSVTSKGDSPASVQSSAVVPFSVPNAPTITSVVAGNKTVSIFVTDGSNNGQSIINYEYSEDGIKYNIVDPVSPIVLNNLANWQSYSYYVRAVNIAGSSLPSAQSTAVVPFFIPTSASITNIIPGDRQLTVIVDGWTTDAGIIGYKYSLDQVVYTYVAAPSASFVITGLVNGQDYTVSARSVTVAGDSPNSQVFAPVYPRAPPSAPTNVVVTPLDESAEIEFVDGSSNGAPIQYYLYSINGDVDTPVKTRPDGVLKIFGISNAINYTLRLRAVNSAGVSPYSVESNVFMPYGVPLIPPVITQILPGNGCAYVYFSEVDTNGAPLTKFRWTNGTTRLDVSGTTSPLMITGLANKKAVTIAIASCNQVGESPMTVARSIIPGVPLPPVITNVVASDKRLLVYFDVPENNGFPIITYMYGFVGSPAFVRGNPASTTSVSPMLILNLKNGTPYNVQIVATNANGNSVPSNSLGPLTPSAPPMKIAITTALAQFDGAIITFVAPLNNGAPLLKYKYALNSDTTYTDVSGLNLPVRIYGIAPNTVNTVKLIATNSAGDSIESAPSKPFTFIYLPPAVVKITALTITLGQLRVAFLPPATNGSPVIGYKYALNADTVFTDASSMTLPLLIDSGILPNVLYNVRIIAVNAAGMSAPSAPAAKAVMFTYLPPLPPAITTIIAGNGSALVTFTGLPSRGAPITGYAYTLDASAAVVYDMSGAISPLTITGLTNETLYNVRVAAITPAGYSAWSPAKPVIPVYKVPSKPMILAISSKNGHLDVGFTPPAENGSPIFLYKYTLNGGEKIVVDTIIGGKSFTITKNVVDGVDVPLVIGTVYNVQICATNVLGDSELSPSKPGTPKA